MVEVSFMAWRSALDVGAAAGLQASIHFRAVSRSPEAAGWKVSQSASLRSSKRSWPARRRGAAERAQQRLGLLQGGPAIEPEMSTTNTVRVGRPASPFPTGGARKRPSGGSRPRGPRRTACRGGVLFRQPPGRDHVAIGGDLPGRGGEALEPHPAGRRDELGNGGSRAKRIATEAVGKCGMTGGRTEAWMVSPSSP